MTAENDVPVSITGFGLIPKDWIIARLGDLGMAKIGLTYSPNDVRRSGALVLRSSNIKESRIDFHDTVYVDPLVVGGSIVHEGDILVCARNGSRDLIGKSASIDQQAAGSAFGAFMSIFRSPDNDILRYHFKYKIIAKQVQAHLGATINQITNKSLNGFCVPLPRALSERRAIAEALGDVDALIGALDALIAKKRDVKRGAMQRLLTGAIRLPGFSVSWHSRPFAALAKIRNEKVDTFGYEHATQCVELEQIESETGSVRDYQDASQRHSIKYCFAPDDVLFGRLRPYLRKYWKANTFGVCSTEIWPLVAATDMIEPSYLSQVVRTDRFIQIASEAYGTHMPRADWKSVSGLVVPLPSDLEEQRAIAAVLSDMDAEIEALEARRTKTADLKKGMMRDLLTGRVRLTGTGEKRAMEAAE